MKKITILTLLFALIAGVQLKAQDVTERPVQPGVPFLTIAPDARGSSMGDIGAATSPDVTSIFYNAAKYSFIKKKAGLEVSYSPWLRGIASDMSINYMSGFYKINDKQAFSASLKYFAIGEIQFTNEFGEPITASKPNELALSAAYSMMFTDNLSGAITMKFIYSNLTGGVSTGLQTHPGVAVAGDLSFFYNKPFTLKNNDAKFTWGLALSNLGTKINYGSNIRPFIPSNFKTGVGFQYKIDDFNSFSVSAEMNKLMVPTPDSAGTYYDLSVTEGIIRSFYDAPGGFKEELHEVIFSGGAEYNYNNLFFLRGGLFYENPNKGGRRFISTGLGFKYSVFSIDFSYLVPLYSQSPLANTMRFTLSFYFDKNTK